MKVPWSNDLDCVAWFPPPESRLDNLFSSNRSRRGAAPFFAPPLQSANKLRKKSKVEVLDSNLVVADVTTPGLLEAAIEGIESVVLCTSAVPKVITVIM